MLLTQKDVCRKSTQKVLPLKRIAVVYQILHKQNLLILQYIESTPSKENCSFVPNFAQSVHNLVQNLPILQYIGSTPSKENCSFVPDFGESVQNLVQNMSTHQNIESTPSNENWQVLYQILHMCKIWYKTCQFSLEGVLSMFQ